MTSRPRQGSVYLRQTRMLVPHDDEMCHNLRRACIKLVR
jgi:hypothetical protein